MRDYNEVTMSWFAVCRRPGAVTEFAGRTFRRRSDNADPMMTKTLYRSCSIPLSKRHQRRRHRRQPAVITWHWTNFQIYSRM